MKSQGNFLCEQQFVAKVSKFRYIPKMSDFEWIDTTEQVQRMLSRGNLEKSLEKVGEFSV